MIKWLEKYEYWLTTIVIVFIAIVFSLGFITAIFSSDYDKFTGVIGVAKGDKTVYISMIEQIKQGDVFNDNLFTSEQQNYGLFHPLWFKLGTGARLLHLSSFEVFHIAKFFSIIIFLFSLYFIFRKFFSISFRFLSLFGLAFFGGLGRFAMLFSDTSFSGGDLFFKLIPVDIWFSEGFSFLTLYHSPLFIFSQLLMIISWWFILWSLKNSESRYSIFAGISILFLGFIHPFDMFGWWAVIAALIVVSLLKKNINWKNVFKTLLPSLIASIIVVWYYGFLLINEPVLSAWNNQNNMPPPSFFSMLTGYGLLWILSITGLIFIIKNKTGMIWDWLVIWFLTFPLLLFVPINISRRLMSSFGVIIIIMSIFGIEHIWKTSLRDGFMKKKIPIGATTGIIVFLLFLVLSPVYQIIESVYEVREKKFPIYLSCDQKKIVNFLNNSPRDSVILAEPFFANSIPALTGRHVWLGHDVQTVNFEEKKKELYRFYIMPWSEWHEQFVKENNIDYVIWPGGRVSEIPNKFIEVRTEEKVLLSF